MSAKWKISVPPRVKDEEDATDKQLGFIRHLFIVIESEPLEFKDGDLGKRQASSLIDQLVNIRDGNIGEYYVGTQEKRKVSLLLGFGIFILPYVFTWFLFRKGHSITSKVISFTWLLFCIYSITRK